MRICSLALILYSLLCSAVFAGKKVKVFVALCDNKTQGIMPVGAKIGNGDDADANLYWGCSDGLGRYFKKSKEWRLVSSKRDVTKTLLREMKFSSKKGDVSLVAYAYRGSEMRQCMIDFEKAAASGENDLVAYIGHNGLMDFELPETPKIKGNSTDVMVLCCVSDGYFSARLRKLGCDPVLLTKQLMYPGAFILHDVLRVWETGASKKALRLTAAKAYAKNQKISVKSAAGVFAKLQDK